jgi:RNA polymerase sigma-70 factor (ECF subfamily)
MVAMVEAVSGGMAARAEYVASIERVRAGEQAAARELVERLYPIVVRIVRAHRPRRVAEEDLTQDIFIKMFARLGQYRGDAPFEHWVSRIAVTTCMDQLRAQKCRPELRWSDLSLSEVGALEFACSQRRDGWPGDAFAARELVHKLLDRLNTEDRMVVVWFELEEKTIAEIRALTGWSINLVKMRLFRARKKLQRLFEDLPGYDGTRRATRRRQLIAGAAATRALAKRLRAAA